MKKLLTGSLFWLLCAVAVWAIWTVVSHPAATTCSSGTACTQVFTVTNTGDLLVANLISENTSGTETVSSFTAAGCSVAWTRGPHLSVATAAGAVEIWYCFTSSAGASLTIGPTWTGTAGATQLHITAIREFSSSTGSIALDSGATPSCSSSGTIASPVMCALVVSGNNHIFSIAAGFGGTLSACNQSYVCTFPSGVAEGYLPNSTTYTAPTITGSGSNPFVEAAIAFQEAPAAGGSTPAIDMKQKRDRLDDFSTNRLRNESPSPQAAQLPASSSQSTAR